MIANIWRENDKPCSSRALLFVEILTPLGKVSQNTAPSFLENLNLWCASFRRFVIEKENKMKPWKRHILTTHTVCKDCLLICYETDMGPEIPTAAAD